MVFRLLRVSYPWTARELFADENLGLPLWAVTIQNESKFPAPWEACAYTARANAISWQITYVHNYASLIQMWRFSFLIITKIMLLSKSSSLSPIVLPVEREDKRLFPIKSSRLSDSLHTLLDKEKLGYSKASLLSVCLSYGFNGHSMHSLYKTFFTIFSYVSVLFCTYLGVVLIAGH